SLPLHDALPISAAERPGPRGHATRTQQPARSHLAVVLLVAEGPFMTTRSWSAPSGTDARDNSELPVAICDPIRSQLRVIRCHTLPYAEANSELLVTIRDDIPRSTRSFL